MLLKLESELKFKDRLRVYMSLSLAELKKHGHPLYDVISKKYPNLDESLTVDDARVLKLMEKIFVESSNKSIELSYKLDGSLNDAKVQFDFEEIERLTKGVK